MTIAIVSPTSPQFDYITTEEPYPAMVAGFGSGKTEAAVKRAIIGAYRYPTLNRGFYEPTYDLVRMIAFPRFEEALESMGLGYRLYKSPLNYIDLEGAGKIFFRSMDAPHRIIGYEHADADIDELDTLKKKDAQEVWLRVLSRNRQSKPDGRPNTIGVTTTPEGFKFVYDSWKKNPQEGYQLIKAPTSSNPHLPKTYIPSLRQKYPPALLDAYIEGEFVNLTSGSVYPEFCRELNGTNMTLAKADELGGGKVCIHIGMDFNVNKMAATVWVIVDGKPHGVGEIMRGRDTPSMIESIKARYPGRKIIVYPDSSGDSGSSKGASLTDFSLIRAAGFSIDAPNANPAVKDRVNSVCAMILNADGDRRMLINAELMPDTVECLEQQVYNEQGAPDKSSDNDHAPDSLGYFIHRKWPINKPIISTSKLRG